jgi:hypothetical protein
VIIAADCYAAVHLSIAGEFCGHTRSTVVKTAIESAGLSDAIVVYVNDASSNYFAFIYFCGGRLRQYIVEGSGLHSIGSPVEDASERLCDLNAGTLLLVANQQVSAETLQFLITHPGVRTQAFQMLEKFVARQLDASVEE